MSVDHLHHPDPPLRVGCRTTRVPKDIAATQGGRVYGLSIETLTHPVALEPICLRYRAAGSGYTMQGGNQRANVEPLYTHFGREATSGPLNRWLGR